MTEEKKYKDESEKKIDDWKKELKNKKNLSVKDK